MDFQTYKISEIYQNNNYVPSIRFNGKWLEDLNFNVGEEVVVYKEKNRIIISKPTEEEKQKISEQRKRKELKKLVKKIKSI